jgi:hypothetical protein
VNTAFLGQSMIEKRQKKIDDIIKVIKTRINEINRNYKRGPELYFYQRLLRLRSGSKTISSFLKSNYNFEIIYATLVSWDMNSRAAKMKCFDKFKSNILSCESDLIRLEGITIDGADDCKNIIDTLKIIYPKLCIMRTKSKLVSNSKLLHFLFPELLMPMDRKNTLNYFYNNTNDSFPKYLEIIELSFEIAKRNIAWEKYVDEEWNSTIPKIIDNAIILLELKNIKKM